MDNAQFRGILFLLSLASALIAVVVNDWRFGLLALFGILTCIFMMPGEILFALRHRS